LLARSVRFICAVTLFWLPLLCDAPSAIPGELEWLQDEAKQLTRIFASSQTAKGNSDTRRPRD